MSTKFSKPAIAGAMVVAVIAIVIIAGLANFFRWATTPPVPETVPGPTVTVTQTPAPAPTQTVEVEVPVTPEACSEFIEDADALVQMEADVIDIASEMIDAISTNDAAKLNSLTAKLEKLTPKIRKAKDAYADSRASCATT